MIPQINLGNTVPPENEVLYTKTPPRKRDGVKIYCKKLICNALSLHSLSNLDKACDVSTCNKVVAHTVGVSSLN